MPFHYQFFAVTYDETDPDKNQTTRVTRLVRCLNIVDPLQRIYFDDTNVFRLRRTFENLEVLKSYGYAPLGSEAVENIMSEYLKEYPISQ